MNDFELPDDVDLGEYHEQFDSPEALAVFIVDKENFDYEYEHIRLHTYSIVQGGVRVGDGSMGLHMLQEVPEFRSYLRHRADGSALTTDAERMIALDVVNAMVEYLKERPGDRLDW